MGPGLDEPPRQVIGVVADVCDAGFNQIPMMYIPIAQLSDAMNARNNRLLPITWVIRTAAGSNPPTAAVQRKLRELSGGRPLEPVHTMHEVVAASSARTGFYIMLLIPFAVIALLLAAVGLYGLIADSVQQRTQEIGVRMALGAGPEDVRFMVVLQGMRLAFLGIVIGIPAALALTRVMVHLIFGIPTWDPLVLAAVAFLLSAVALFATCLPAIRATRIDPMDALRY
jgi:putative ABC transport system permease protein